MPIDLGWNRKFSSQKGKDEMSDDNDDEEISPLLATERKWVKITAMVFRAQGISHQGGSTCVSLVKNKTEISSYVKIILGDLSGQTSVKKGTSNPVWDQQLSFVQPFPPECDAIKIQLIRSDMIHNTIIAMYRIDLANISKDGDQGYLPTLGPCLLHLYGSEKGNSCENLEEATCYKGSLLIALRTRQLDVADETCTEVKMESIDSSENFLTKNYYDGSFEEIGEKFLLFGCIFEVSMVNKKLGQSPVALELSIGNSHIDGNENFTFVPPSSTPMEPMPLKKDYMYLPYEDSKPCLGGCCVFPDQRRRSYLSNYLEFICTNLRKNVEVIDDMILRDKGNAEEKLEEVLTLCLHEIRQFFPAINTNRTHALKNTSLDKERMAFVYSEMKSVLNNVSKFIPEIRKRSIKKCLLYVYDILQRMEDLIEDPQHDLPDVFLWMTIAGRRVAFRRILARHILYSAVEKEAGKDHGKAITLFLEVNPEKRKRNFSTFIQAKVVIFVWLGLATEKRHILQKLPGGYCCTPELKRIEDLECALPNFIHYTEIHEFELRANVYQARALVAADESGLSDPYVRIVFYNTYKETQVVPKSLNPTWNELLIFELVRIYGDEQKTKENPPTFVVEVFDYDKLSKSKLIGRAFICPTVQLERDDNYHLPVLQWHELSSNDEHCSGDILLSLQLEQLRLSNLKGRASILETQAKQSGVLTIPEEIRPILSTYRLEVLFWGMRDLKKFRLQRIRRPRVDIECGGQVLQSSVVQYKNHQNFQQPVKFMDLQLPEQEIYRPPLTIRVVDCGNFGMSSTIGVHIIKCLQKYMLELEDEAEKNEKQIFYKTDTGSKLSKHTIIDFEKQRSKTIIERRSSSFKVDKTDGVKEEEEEYKDWWTRYFNSQNTSLGKGVSGKSQKHSLRHMNPRYSIYYSRSTTKGRINIGSTPDDFLAKGNRDQSIVEKYEDRIADLESLIKIYPCELEKVGEFGDFEEWMHSFHLYRGKQKTLAFDDEKRKAGVFKGSFKLYKLPLPYGAHDPYLLPSSSGDNGSYFEGTPNNGRLQILVRIYIVKAINLHPQDANNKVDPYIVARLGSQKISDKENYISGQTNPVFGKCFTFEANFPQDSLLIIQIYDWDLMRADDLVGETKIDLENRYFSRHRATCGIFQKFELTGINAWRDPETPKLVLADLCKKWELDGPYYFHDAIQVESEMFSFPGLYSKLGNDHREEIMALEVLKKWEEVGGFKLVPEHIETRSLYHPLKSEEQGKIEMWIDMFAMPLSQLPPEINIAPRKPVSYELRIIIWNTDDVILADDSALTGEKSSDIYVKGWIIGKADEQKTDVHYGSQTGEGNFNWRFIFPFDYFPADKEIVACKRESRFSWDQMEVKMAAKLNLQVWDADHFSADDCLGSVVLDLNHIPRGAKNSDHCSLYMLEKDTTIPHVSIFKQATMRGWWPVFQEKDNGGKELTGKIEIEFQLLTKKEADLNPVGRGRKEPEPLELPQRPASSMSSFFNPMKAMRFAVWRRFKRVIIKGLILAAFILLLLLFLYNVPGYSVKKIMGA